jgi:hypothetical protein
MKKKRGNKKLFLAIISLIFIIILSLLFGFFSFSSTIGRLFTAIGVIGLFYIIDHLSKTEFKVRHYIFISLMAVSSILFFPIYFEYVIYDKIQHFFLPILYSSIVFYFLSKQKSLKISQGWLLAFTFFIVIGSLGLFEIGEYLGDIVFDLKLQGVFSRNPYDLNTFEIILQRIDDTMIDLSLGVIGSLLYVLANAIFFQKNKK